MRKAQAKKLPLAPDPKFNDKLVTRFVNNLMWGGKKSTAYDIFYNAIDRVSKVSLSIKWLIRYSRDRNGKTMADKLANEIVAASKGEGAAFKKKEDTHRMADANKAFAHFRI